MSERVIFRVRPYYSYLGRAARSVNTGTFWRDRVRLLAITQVKQATVLANIGSPGWPICPGTCLVWNEGMRTCICFFPGQKGCLIALGGRVMGPSRGSLKSLLTAYLAANRREDDLARATEHYTPTAAPAINGTTRQARAVSGPKGVLGDP